MARVVAFGDSITRGYGLTAGEGWVELLAEALKRDRGENAIPVFNAGGNGNTSTEGLQRIEADVLGHMPGLVFVEFGGNDTVHDDRAVGVEKFQDNLLAIIARIRNHGGEVVLLTFPPVVNEWHAWSSDPYYAQWDGLDQCVEQYRQCTRDVAKLQAVLLFDLDRFLRTLIVEKGQAAIIKPDGIHLTPEANQLISVAIFHFLQDRRP
jgi:lysophospholipase L1-like esterase